MMIVILVIGGIIALALLVAACCGKQEGKCACNQDMKDCIDCHGRLTEYFGH